MTASLSGVFNLQVETDAGVPAASYRLYTYSAGTTTLKTAYTDAAASVPHTYTADGLGGQYIALDARGELPAPLFLTSGGYDLALKTPAGATVWTRRAYGLDDNSATLDAALRAELAANNNAAKGAGLIAYGPTVAYATSTVGARVNKAGHASATNVLLGYGAANDASLTGTVGYRTTAVGVGAGAAIGSAVTAGGSNAWFGYGSGNLNTEGSGNCAYGALALPANTTGDHSNAFGYRTLDKQTTGTQNNVFGFEGMFSLTAGNNNCGFGESVLHTMTSGNGNCAFGMQALRSKTTGDYSTAYGFQAAYNETTAVGNVAVGKEALYNFTSQGGNTALGYEAGRGAAGGVNNTMVGYQAATAINGGTYNSTFGYSAHLRLTTGGSNVAAGQQAGAFVTTGSETILIGPNAGAGVTTKDRAVVIGSGAQASLNVSNCVVLGYNAQATGDNQVVLGDANISQIRAQVTTITALSDARDKKDIAPLDLGLAFINTLRPVAFTWDMRGGSERNGEREAGFIAQELRDAQRAADVDWLGLVYEADPERLEATPGKLLPILVKAVQELSAEVARLRAALEAA